MAARICASDGAPHLLNPVLECALNLKLAIFSEGTSNEDHPGQAEGHESGVGFARSNRGSGDGPARVAEDVYKRQVLMADAEVGGD